MTANDFLHLVKPDTEITALHLEDIQQLVAKMPWFAASQILLLKAMKQRNISSFEDFLARTSLHVTRRDLLAVYLQNVKEIIKIEDIDDVVVQNLLLEDDIQKQTVQNSVQNLFLGENDGFELMDEDDSDELTQSPPVIESQNKQIQLIDDFIMNFATDVDGSPQLPFEDPAPNGVDLASPYLRTPDDFVSETLMEIYISQGYFDCAKQTFNKLSLLYPEKKAYFATRFSPIVQQQTA